MKKVNMDLNTMTNQQGKAIKISKPKQQPDLT